MEDAERGRRMLTASRKLRDRGLALNDLVIVRVAGRYEAQARALMGNGGALLMQQSNGAPALRPDTRQGRLDAR
jgi:hypothetical protein